jgi:hypothetical protein
MLKNQYGRFMQAHELLPLFGIPSGHHLPKEGFGIREIQGVQFMCRPAAEPRTYERYGLQRKVKVSKHRLFYLCKECRAWIPYGRAGQHVKGKEHKENVIKEQGLQ